MARFALSAATSRRISTAFADSRCVDSCNAAIEFLFGIPAKCLLASPFTYAPLKEKEEASAVKPAVPKVAKPGKGFITRQRTVRLCYSTPAGLHSRRRECWADSVIAAAWSLGGRRVRSSRAGLGLAALAHPGFVRIRIAVVEYGRGKVGASTAPRRRPQKPSPARRRAASRRRERVLRSARLAPARDGRRARSLSHLSIPTLRARCVARDRGITTEPQRGARPAPPSHELVSRPPRRRKPTRCLKA